MKKKAQKEMRTENTTLREKLEEGRKIGRWVNQQDCAEKIGVPRGTLGQCSTGFIHGEKVISVIAAMQQLIDDPTATATPTPVSSGRRNATLATLFQQGKTKGLWNNITECAKRALKKDRGTFTKYLELETGDTPMTRREKTYYAKLIRVMRSKLGTPPPGNPLDDSPPGRGHPIASAYYDRLLAGVTEMTDQNLGGIRFVLTQRNFKKFKGVVTKQEVEDTKLLIQELRRRLNLVAQNENEDVRALCFHELSIELNELLLSAQLVQEVVPTKAVAQLQTLREKL
jgi:hypothetical protein